MYDPTSRLFGMSDYRVLEVTNESDPAGEVQSVKVVIESVFTEEGCPACGAISARIKQRRLRRIRDLPSGGRPIQVWLHGRRFVCAATGCKRKSFTQSSRHIPARSRLTSRLRTHAAWSVARSNRAVSDVAGEYELSWPTVHKALITAAKKWIPEPEPTRALGIDETRARSVRWVCSEQIWQRTNPWMTSFVNADPEVPGRLLGLSSGRSAACVTEWLEAQTEEFRAGIEIAVIDPSAPYAAGIRAALPNAKIAVDHWHLVRLANDMLTKVRQRVLREQHGRRGRATDAMWTHRNMLLTGQERLSEKQHTRLQTLFDTQDPNQEIAAAWACKEHLRTLLASGHEPTAVKPHLEKFYQACAKADLPETSKLAATIKRWWPHIEIFLETGVTNARTEGFNRVIKQVKRTGCGYRNMDNYERRILTHIALSRPTSTTRHHPAQN